MSYFYDVINPFTVNIGAVYLQYHLLFDPIIAFLIFLSIASYVFKNKYGGREGKAVAIAVGLALTFAFAVLELSTGFYFGHPVMQGLAGLILLFVFGVLLYSLILAVAGDTHKMCAFAITYFVVYGTLMSIFSPLYHNLQMTAPIVWSLFGILFLISFIAIIMCVIGLFPKGKPGEDYGGGHGDGHGHGEAETASTDSPPAPPPRISVDLTTGSAHFPPGTPVEAIAAIHGGSGEYVYKWEESPMGITSQGTGKDEHVKMTFKNLAPGPHTIRIAVVDRKDSSNRDGKAMNIVIDTAPPLPTSDLLHDRILQYRQNVRRFKIIVAQYNAAGAQVLHATHAVFRAQGSPSDLAAKMKDFTDIGNAIVVIVHQLQRDARDIADDPAFTGLPQADVKTLTEAHNEYFVTVANLAGYQQRFQEEYNKIRP